MGPIEKQMREECQRVLKLVEEHLAKYPMGETYLGVKACNYPHAVPNLKANKIVGPVILDGLVGFIEERETRLSNVPVVGEAAE